MKNMKSLKSQLVLQFAIVILPMTAILLYQTISDIYHSEGLARSYRHLGACHDIKSNYMQFVNGAVDAVDTGELGTGALRALDDAAEKLRNLAREDHTGNFVKLQENMDHIFAALINDRSITALVPLRQLINQVDTELGNEYLRYEKENRQAIEANITFAKIQKITVSGAILITVLLSMMVGRSITISITRPITEAVAFAQSIILDPGTEAVHGKTRLAQKDLANQEKVKATGEVQMLVDSINRMAEDLEKRNRQLIAAQKELVRKEKLAMLGLIAEGMGNELRNPLGVMNNAVFFLKNVTHETDGTVREYLDIIENEIGKSLAITSDLLDFYRITTPKTEAVPVRELIDQSLSKCAIPDNIRLKVHLPDMPLAVKADPQQMGQVLRNLTTNAVQAMPDGGALRVSARLVGAAPCGCPEAGGHTGPPLQDFIEISVADIGVGIAPENLEKLFQPLYSTKSRGIGLGLALSRKLTEANGGRIEVESRLGEGTTFRVMLPVEG